MYVVCAASSFNIIQSCLGKATIDILPDELLLEIFSFYILGAQEAEVWRKLVRVCRRWRILVFASPRRLDLYLLCTARTFKKEKLDIWPTLPIEVRFQWGTVWGRHDAYNIMSGLGRHERVRCISLVNIHGTSFKRFIPAMQVPFPELTDLKIELRAYYSPELAPPVLPGSFLSGSAPQLRRLELEGISFPEIHKLHLSASLLVRLVLWNIPRSGYVSPEAMHLQNRNGLSRAI
jgi:hypothetical protein